MTPNGQPKHARHVATIDPYDEPTAPTSWEAAFSLGEARAKSARQRSRSETGPVTRGRRRRRNRSS